jgi:hypothetical protein
MGILPEDSPFHLSTIQGSLQTNETATTSSDMKKSSADLEAETLVLKQDTVCYQNSPQQGFPPMILSAGTKVTILKEKPLAGYTRVRTDGQKCYMQ